jgi:hypothetical protein
MGLRARVRAAPRALAYWWPESAFTSPAERGSALRALVRRAEQSAVALVVTSATDEHAAMALARELPASPRGDLVSRLPSWRDALPDRPNRLLLRDTLGLPETVALQDGRTPWLPTPIRSLQPTTAHQLRWVAEVAVRDWCAKRPPTLGPQLLARTQTIASTSSRGAIAASSTRRPGGPCSDRRGVPRRAGGRVDGGCAASASSCWPSTGSERNARVCC